MHWLKHQFRNFTTGSRKLSYPSPKNVKEIGQTRHLFNARYIHTTYDDEQILHIALAQCQKKSRMSRASQSVLDRYGEETYYAVVNKTDSKNCSAV